MSDIDVRAHGAIGDGVTDDSGAFQRAIDAAYLQGGGIVSVPGSPIGFLVRRPILLRPNVTLRGFHTGPADAHFLAQADGEAPELDSRLPGGVIIDQNEHPA